VENFIYLDPWIEGTERDIKVREGMAWADLHRLKDIWNSKLQEINDQTVHCGLRVSTAVGLRNLDIEKGSREKFGRDIH
jgi:hypothetical protein